MARQSINPGGNRWPVLDETPDGEEIHVVYDGPVMGSYQGEPREECHFHHVDGGAPLSINGKGFLAIWKPSLEVGAAYFIKFVGMKKTDNGKAFVFEIDRDVPDQGV